MASTPIQTSFSKGEISRHLRGRIDASIFHEGLDYCENWWPLAHGPLLMRPGGVDGGTLPNDGGLRFVRLRMSDGQDYLLVLSNYRMRLYSVATGQQVIVTGRDLAMNGDFNGVENWTLRAVPGGSGDANGDGVISFGQLVLSTYEFAAPPLVITTPVYIYSKQARQQIVTDQAYSGHIYLKLRSITGGDIADNPNKGYKVVKLLVLVETGNGSGLLVKHVVDRATPDGSTIDIPFAMPGGSTNLNINLYLSSDSYCNVHINPCRCEVDDLAVVVDRAEGWDIVTPWAANQLDRVQWDTESAQDHTVFAHPQVQPWSLKYDSRGGGFWNWKSLVYQGTPPEWGSGSWPEAVQFHDGRLYFAMRNTLYGSRLSSPFDFRTRTDLNGNPTDEVNENTTITAECAFWRRLATKGIIRWISSGKVLLVGTDISQHSVTAQGGALIPNDFHATTESRFQAAAMMAVDAGNHALYVSKDRKKVYAIAYARDADGWESKDITFLGSHITEDRIKEIHYTEGLILALLDSGKFAACAYNPGEKSVGWWRITIGGQASVITAALSEGPDGAFLWEGLRRTYPGGPPRPPEVRLEKITLSDSSSAQYLDSAVRWDLAPYNGEAVTALGFDRFNETEVMVIANGKYQGKQIVHAGAVQVLESGPGPLLTLWVGFMPTYKAVTLVREPRDGKIHHAKIGVQIEDSALPLINGKRPKDRSPSTPFDTPEPRRTGKAVLGNLGWDGEGKITIEQDLPIRTEILSLFAISERGEE